MGEGITEGELLAWKVKEGDVVAEDQTLAEVETDKAVVELPSPRAGRIAQLHAAEGDIIKVGQVVVTIEEGAGAPGAAAGRDSCRLAVARGRRRCPAPCRAGRGRGRALHRVGGRAGWRRRPRKRRLAARPPSRAAGRSRQRRRHREALAMPSVRALARELGVDLTGIRGTGPGGRILKQDVRGRGPRRGLRRRGPSGGRGSCRQGTCAGVAVASVVAPAP